jgi:type IV pilus assembly protein PilB
MSTLSPIGGPSLDNVTLLDTMLEQAVAAGASDLHLLPEEERVRVRIRVDGVVRELEPLRKDQGASVVARIKVNAKLDIAEHRKPQDGRMSDLPTLHGHDIEVRVATLPTVTGEGVVMRFLERSSAPPTLTEIGLSFDDQMALELVLHRSSGAVLVTGPTGSGKSTTLHAALSDIARPEINVITIEDPVKRRLAGAYQIQVNPKADVTFASALRSALRSDPDVVMVGEMRDTETAKIAIEAALTGHQVLSTMHAGDAPGAIARLTKMGVEPYLTASAVSAVLAQRLVRRLCLACREPYTLSPDEAAAAGFPPGAVSEQGLVAHRARGCASCNRGYAGRIGIYQMLLVEGDVAELAVKHATHEELEQAALAAGMRTLFADGLAKVAAGVTSLEEIHRILV